MYKIIVGILFLSCICASQAHSDGEIWTSITNGTHPPVAISGECFRSCLILALGNMFESHVLEGNIEEIKWLMHYSFKNCPGLLSTFKIFGKFLEIKQMQFNQTLEWIQTGYDCDGNGTTHERTTPWGWAKTSTFAPFFTTTTVMPQGK